MRKLVLWIILLVLISVSCGTALRGKVLVIGGKDSTSKVASNPTKQATPIQITPTAFQPTTSVTSKPKVENVTPTKSVVVIEPTVNPGLLNKGIRLSQVNISVGTDSFNPIINEVVKTLFEPGTQITGTVLDGSLDDVPELEGLGPPVLPGESIKKTDGGYDYGDWSSMVGATHWAIDMCNVSYKLGAASKGKIYAILFGAQAYKYGSGGQNVLVIAKLPQGFKDPNGQEMSGWVLFGSGHMVMEVPVTVGQQVDAGQWIGDIGLTGLTTGYHTHYYVVWLKPDRATIQFLNPHEWGAIGTR